MSKHTPGPWRLEDIPAAGLEIKADIEGFKDPLSLFQMPGNENLSFGIGKDNQVYVTLSYETWMGGPGKPDFWEGMQKANAQLISATPDLYEACKEALRMYKEIQPCGGWQDVEDSLEYAIKKAEGKPN